MAEIKPEALGAAIEKELIKYHSRVIDKLNAAGAKSMRKLVRLTKESAPEGARGSFRRNITSKEIVRDKRGNTYIWGVKPPDHRLTHLLVRPHATKDGGRTKGDPFLQNALDEVLPKYEKAVEKAIKDA